MLNKIF